MGIQKDLVDIIFPPLFHIDLRFNHGECTLAWTSTRETSIAPPTQKCLDEAGMTFFIIKKLISYQLKITQNDSPRTFCSRVQWPFNNGLLLEHCFSYGCVASTKRYHIFNACLVHRLLLQALSIS